MKAKGVRKYDDLFLSAVATGNLEGVVALDRDDGSLQLLDLRYDLSGEYSCAVMLTNDKRYESAKWEVLIVGMSVPSTLHSSHTYH